MVKDVGRNVAIQMKHLEECADENHEYGHLYEPFPNDSVRTILATLHHAFVELYQRMNTRLPATAQEHYWADESRRLIRCIDVAYSLQSTLVGTADAFVVDENYDELFKRCREFLKESGGSEIPVGMQRVEIYYDSPIFMRELTINITRGGGPCHRAHPLLHVV